MRRHELTDELFNKIEHMLPGRKEHAGVTAKDNRLFINGVLWIFKTGAPWRDLPNRYGPWSSCYNRFNRWSATGVWQNVWEALKDDLDNENHAIDGSIVKAHQDACRVKKKQKKRSENPVEV